MYYSASSNNRYWSTPMEQVMSIQLENLASFWTDFVAISVSCLIPLEQHIQSLDEI
jgi:hypothetical protein